MSAPSYQAHSATDAFVVTPGASPIRTDGLTVRGLYVGTGGNITVTMASGRSLQFADVPPGFILPVQVTHVTAATASGIIALV